MHLSINIKIAVCLFDLELLEKENYDKFHNKLEIVVDGSRSLLASRIWKVLQQCMHFLSSNFCCQSLKLQLFD